MWAGIEYALGEPINLHIGGISTDLSTGVFDGGRCGEDGDGGRLGCFDGQDFTGYCRLLPNQRYLADTTPDGCHVVRNDMGLCESHTCTEENCQAAAEGSEQLTLASNHKGCPRCVNYDPTIGS
jgi:hypothetical protein